MEDLRLVIKHVQDASRYEHTLGVAYTAACLAGVYGIDTRKAIRAGLLHDCAKCLSNEELEAFSHVFDDSEKLSCKTWHAPAGEVVARRDYGVTDEEAAAQISLIGSIENYPCYCLFMDYPNEIRIRIRSRGPRIDLLAHKYRGGGHEKAAGAKLSSWDELPQFIADLDALNKYYRETGKEDLF